MTDIVERLRGENSCLPYYGPPKLQMDAAAEIERLRAALIDVLSYVPHGDMPVTIYDNARAALAEAPRTDTGSQEDRE